MNHNRILITGPKLHPEAYLVLKRKTISFIDIPAYSGTDKIVDVVKKSNINAIIVRTGKVTSEVIDASNKLGVITKHGIGIDNIDIEYAGKHKIPVLITPTAIARSVAEHAVGMIYSLARRINFFDRRMRQGIWDFDYCSHNLRKKKLGIIGYGRIAKMVIDLIKPTGMSVIVYDKYVTKNLIPPDIELSDLVEVLQQADFLSIHCPLTNETKYLIGKEELKKMKRSAYLINTSRGEIVDKKALINALERNFIAGAGIDTFINEPEIDKDYFNLENLIMSPHKAGMDDDSIKETGIEAVKNTLNVLAGVGIDFDLIVNRKYF